MSDNITVSDSTTTASTVPNGTVIATDDVGGAQYQRVKLDVGGDGVSSPVTDLASGAKQDTGNSALLAIQTAVETIDNAISGTEMQVDVVTLPAIPSGTNVIGHVIVDTAPTTAVTGPLTDAELRASAVPVSGTFYQATQPVSIATLPTLAAGTNNIGDVDVLTVPADPFGANADAASATGSISAKLRFIAATGIPITGTVTVGSHAVTNAGTFATQNEPLRSSSASVTTVSDTASSTTLLSSNASRRGASFFNNSTSTLYMKFGTTASATDFTIAMAASSFYVLDAPVYTGRIDGIWSSDSTGAVLITELT